MSRRNSSAFLLSIGLHLGVFLLLFFALQPSRLTTQATSVNHSFPIAIEENAQPTAKSQAPRPRQNHPDVLAQATAETKSEPAPQSTPQASDRSVEIANFSEVTRTRVQRELRYPIHLRRRGITGAPWVRFKLTGDGKVEELRISTTSGNAELDELALEAVHAAAPFGRVPGKEKTGRIEMTLPVDFRIVR